MNGDLSNAPRWFLLLLAGGFLAGLVAFAYRVEMHFMESAQGYQRIAILEEQVKTLRAQVQLNQAEILHLQSQHVRLRDDSRRR